MITFEKFTKIFVITSMIILGCIAVFNYWIDPAGIFNNKKVDAAVNYLVNGQPVTGLTNFDERKFKKELLLNSLKTETIVLGSSRAMGIITDFDKDNNSFGNYSVSGANFNDDIALLAVYFNKNQKVPKKVVLAVEPWALNKHRGDTRWKSLEKEYYEGLKLLKFNGEKIKEIDAYRYTFDKIKTLFSISYLRNSFKDFNKEENMPKAVLQDYDKTSIILPDGSIRYGNNVNHLPLKKISQNAENYIANKKHLSA